jgi:hypothetical protein
MTGTTTSTHSISLYGGLLRIALLAVVQQSLLWYRFMWMFIDVRIEFFAVVQQSLVVVLRWLCQQSDRVLAD